MSDAANTASPRAGAFGHLGHVLRENPVTVVAFGLFLLIVGCAIFGPALVPYDPLASNAEQVLKPPSWAHWFGTDALGRDVFSRVIVATQLDLTISVAAVAISFVIGSVLGGVAGY
mgnify:FL=1